MNAERDEHVGRRNKLAQLRELGGVYPNGFKPSATAKQLHRQYDDVDADSIAAAGKQVVVAGRIMLRRVMGKASFVTLQDGTLGVEADALPNTADLQRIQCYFRLDDLGDDVYEQFRQLWDIGDVVGVSGTLMKTNRGELTVHAAEILMLAKSLHPLPEKFHGLTDQEFRYRHRHVDLVMNADSRNVYEVRSQIVAAVRSFFEKRSYLEVETPMMHPIPGGAIARPFVTHHNSLDQDLYLRVAPELYLKRLVVGGFERVFEINRNFRNEGLSTRHNPEFTELEFYVAYQTFTDLMALTTDLLRAIAMRVQRVSSVDELQPVRFQDHELDFHAPPRTARMDELVAESYDVDRSSLAERQTLEALARLSDLNVDQPDGSLLNELFEHRVEATLIQPTFVTHYPVDVSPLARRNEDEPHLTDRFELYIAGREVANGFSELNDPDDQRSRLEAQAKQRQAGDAEAMHLDEEFLTALEYGMPPTAGEGIGIDRLVMLFTNTSAIRDVLFFPHLRSFEA